MPRTEVRVKWTRGKLIEDDPKCGSSEIARELSKSHQSRWRCKYMGSEKVVNPGKLMSFLSLLRKIWGWYYIGNNVTNIGYSRGLWKSKRVVN